MTPGKITPARQWSAWLSAVALLIASWLAVVALSLRAQAGAEVVAVLFPPWWSTQRVFVAAAGAHAAIIRTTAIPELLVVRPDNDDGLKRLSDAGAWLIIDPQAIAACLSEDVGAANDRRRGWTGDPARDRE